MSASAPKDDERDSRTFPENTLGAKGVCQCDLVTNKQRPLRDGVNHRERGSIVVRGMLKREQ